MLILSKKREWKPKCFCQDAQYILCITIIFVILKNVEIIKENFCKLYLKKYFTKMKTGGNLS